MCLQCGTLDGVAEPSFGRTGMELLLELLLRLRADHWEEKQSEGEQGQGQGGASGLAAPVRQSLLAMVRLFCGPTHRLWQLLPCSVCLANLCSLVPKSAF